MASALGVSFVRSVKHWECRNALWFLDRAAFGKAGRKAGRKAEAL